MSPRFNPIVTARVRSLPRARQDRSSYGSLPSFNGELSGDLFVCGTDDRELWSSSLCRVLYTDANAAKLSGDRSQSRSDAPVTGLVGLVEIPSLCIFVMRVVRLTPSLAAAPFGPPTTQLV